MSFLEIFRKEDADAFDWVKLCERHPPIGEPVEVKYGDELYEGTRHYDADGDFLFCHKPDKPMHPRFEINLDVPFVNDSILWRFALDDTMESENGRL